MKTIIITIACLLMGPFLAWQSASKIIAAQKTGSWPSTEGVISSVNLDEISGRKGRVSYRPNVKYGYRVNGVPYGADRIDFSNQSTPSMDEAIKSLSRFQVGQPVTVYYDAKNPAEAVLEIGSAGSHWLGIPFGLVILGVGVFAARGLLRSLNDDKYAPSGTGF